MSKFKIVAYRRTRVEVELEADSIEEAREKTLHAEVYDVENTWIKDNEYYNFHITSIEKVR